MKKKVFFLIGIPVGFLLFGCASKHQEKEVEADFLVTTPLVADTTVNKTYVSQIRSINHIELRAQEKGYLQNVYVDEGQFVKKGQILFKIMPNLYDAEVQKAEAEVNFAEIELKNTKDLTDNNVVSSNELAMAKAKYDKAKAELYLMKTHLSLTTIKAPFDGILNSFHVRLGSLIDEGELLTELSDNRKMWVYFNVPESEYISYMKKENQQNLKNVRLQMANGEMFDQPGIVETIEADFDNETGNIPFRATFSNPKGLLRFGQTGNIVISTPMKKAIMIPQKATFEVLEKKFVYVVDKDNNVKSREITIGAELPHIYVITAGLEANDRFLLEGIRMVKDKDKIKVKSLPVSKVYSDLSLYSE